MIKFELSDADWQTSKRYWSELKKHFTNPDDVKKADFINGTLFESSNLNTSRTIATPTIPSINSISELMNEIDSELKKNGDIDVKTQAEKENKELDTADTDNDNSAMATMDKDIVKFIQAPVEFSFVFCFVLLYFCCICCVIRICPSNNT